MSLACLRGTFRPAGLDGCAGGVVSTGIGRRSGALRAVFQPAPDAGAYALVCLVALVHSPTEHGRRGYAWLALAGALGGALLAGRHVWLQGDLLLADGCPLPVDQILQRPMGEILRMFLLGSPDCVSISWSFLDLTLPEWSLLAFLLLAAMPLSWLVAYRFRKRVMA